MKHLYVHQVAKYERIMIIIIGVELFKNMSILHFLKRTNVHKNKNVFRRKCEL